jgi:hypothetical protein
MNFDPAIAAQTALARLREGAGLSAATLDALLDAEERFSSSAGPEAAEAYGELVALGERHPDVPALQAFLIYITWQQVTEQTIPKHFRHGAELSRRFLDRFGAMTDPNERAQIEALHQSYRAGLGLEDEAEDEEYDKDAFKGGD